MGSLLQAQQEWHNAMLELALVQQYVLNAMAEAELDMEGSSRLRKRAGHQRKAERAGRSGSEGWAT